MANDVKITLRVEEDGSLRLIDEAGKKVGELEKRTQSAASMTAQLGTAWRGAREIAAGFAVAAGAVAAATYAVVRAANEQERGTALLEATLRSTGQASIAYRNELTSLASALQRQTSVGDDAIVSAERLLVSFGAAPAQIERVTRAAIDLSAGLGTDLQGSAVMLGKALSGEFGTLGRYGILVDENASKSEKLAQALSQIEQRFGGSAAASAATFEGRVRGLGEGFGDLFEEVGKVITGSDSLKGGLTSALDTVEDITAAVSHWRDVNREVIDQRFDQVVETTKAVAGWLAEWGPALATSISMLDQFGDGVARVIAEASIGGVESSARLTDSAARKRVANATELELIRRQNSLAANESLDFLSGGMSSADLLSRADNLGFTLQGETSPAEVQLLGEASARVDREKMERDRAAAEAAKTNKTAAAESEKQRAAAEKEILSIIAEQNSAYESQVTASEALLEQAVEQLKHRVEMAELTQGDAAALEVERAGREDLYARTRAADADRRAALEHALAAQEGLLANDNVSAEKRREAAAEINEITVALQTQPSHVAELARQFELVDAKAAAAKQTVFDLGASLREGIGREAQAAFTRGGSIDFANIGKSILGDFSGALIDAQLKKLDFDKFVIGNFTDTIPNAVGEGASSMTDIWSSALDVMSGDARTGTSGIVGVFVDAFRGIRMAGGAVADTLGGLFRNIPGLGQLSGVTSLFGGGGTAASVQAAALGDPELGQRFTINGVPINTGGGVGTAGSGFNFTRALGNLAGLGQMALGGVFLSDALSGNTHGPLGPLGPLGAFAGIGGVGAIASALGIGAAAPALLNIAGGTATALDLALGTGAALGQTVTAGGTAVSGTVGAVGTATSAASSVLSVVPIIGWILALLAGVAGAAQTGDQINDLPRGAATFTRNDFNRRINEGFASGAIGKTLGRPVGAAMSYIDYARSQAGMTSKFAHSAPRGVSIAALAINPLDVLQFDQESLGYIFGVSHIPTAPAENERYLQMIVSAQGGDKNFVDAMYRVNTARGLFAKGTPTLPFSLGPGFDAPRSARGDLESQRATLVALGLASTFRNAPEGSARGVFTAGQSEAFASQYIIGAEKAGLTTQQFERQVADLAQTIGGDLPGAITLLNRMFDPKLFAGGGEDPVSLIDRYADSVAALADVLSDAPKAAVRAIEEMARATEKGLDPDKIQEFLENVKAASAAAQSVISAGVEGTLAGAKSSDVFAAMEAELRGSIGRTLVEAVGAGVTETGLLQVAMEPIEASVRNIFESIADPEKFFRENPMANPFGDFTIALGDSMPMMVQAMTTMRDIMKQMEPAIAIITAPERADAARAGAEGISEEIEAIEDSRLSPAQRDAKRRNRRAEIDQRQRELLVGGIQFGEENELADLLAEERGLVNQDWARAQQRFAPGSKALRREEDKYLAGLKELEHDYNLLGDQIVTNNVATDANTAALQASTDIQRQQVEATVAQTGATLALVEQLKEGIASGEIHLNVEGMSAAEVRALIAEMFPGQFHAHAQTLQGKQAMKMGAMG